MIYKRKPFLLENDSPVFITERRTIPGHIRDQCLYTQLSSAIYLIQIHKNELFPY
jgi:hypothetical protein